MDYALLFFEGIIAFISPCLLPMIPIYITYFAGEEQNSKRTFINALFFVMGFTTIFIAMGFFAGVLSGFFTRHRIIVNIITGAIVMIFGFNYLGIFDIGIINRYSKGREVVVKDKFSSFLFGIVFSISWTPCIGTFLGLALMQASTKSSIPESVLMLLCYSLGMGVPFLFSAILIDRMKAAFDFIKNHYTLINKISGVFLVIIGVLMITGRLWSLLSFLS